MERLSSFDQIMLSLDSTGWPAHNVGLGILDPTAASPPVTLDGLRSRLEARIDRVRPLRRRVVEVPFGLAPGYWVDDPRFDPADHLHQVRVPGPGGPRQLAELAGELGSVPLDLSRPLWECWLVEGVEGGRIAILEKVHHALADGMGAVELLAKLFDTAPDTPDAPAAADAPDGPPPSRAAVLLRVLPDVLSTPLRSAGTATGLAVDVRRGRRARSQVTARAGRVFEGPRVRFNQGVRGAPQRCVAYTSVPLQDVLEVKRAFAVSVNDVVLALAGGSLRRYLGDLGELPDRPLVAGVGVNQRLPGDPPIGNRVSGILPSLRTDLEDPAERLEAINAETAASKEVQQATRGRLVRRVPDLVPPAVWAGVLRLYVGANLVGRTPPMVNLAVSNLGAVPGPLHLCGARVVAHYALPMVAPSLGLLLGVVSSPTSVDVAVSAVRQLVPDPWPIAEGVAEELARLRAAVRERPPRRPRPGGDRAPE